MKLPPRWVRRTLLAPAVVVLVAALLATAPLWLLATLGLAALVPRHFRAPRVLWMAIFYLLWESAALLAMFVLWVASGFGWRLRTPAFQRAHYAVAGALLRILFWQARQVLRLRITVLGDAPDAADADNPLAPGRPLIVASRHAGPGDSFILIHLLINRFRREPRIVLMDTLQWDPAVDVLLNRLPNRFIEPTHWAPDGPGRRTTVEQIADLARGLDGNDALLIFPEGGKFTRQRKFRRIERLVRSGWTGHARRAAALSNVLAPQPGGLLAALDAAPDADVVFIGHTGLEGMATLADVWRELPMDKQIVIHAWHLPHGDIPTDPEARNEWLFTWFERIDGWIDANRPSP